MTNAGSITLEYGDATTLTITPARVTAADAAYDTHAFRPPYSTSWLGDGTGKRTAEVFHFVFEVRSTSIASASASVTTLVTNVGNAALIDTPLGLIRNGGILSVTRSPIELGYRVTIEVVARTGWLANDDAVLRFNSGSVWEVR